MKIDLLERETALDLLHSALSSATSGNGRVVLISGEAGIGKTALVEYFAQQNSQAVRVLRGACDPLMISHPLCPLHDMARQIPDSKLGEMLWNAPHVEILYYYLELLEETTTVAIFEDVHWADQSTLQLLSFLCRRVHQMACLLIVTYRDDELTLEHPLRSALGHYTGSHIQRLHLEPLSEQAVIQWVETTGRSADGFYEATRGNPFYIAEMLASDSGSLPHSITEAVLARMANLSTVARNIVEVTALIPKERLPRSFLKDIWGGNEESLEEVIASGMLRLENDLLVFRHDLARHAVIESMSSVRYKLLNTLILQALIKASEQGQNIGRSLIVHHARMAGDTNAVIEYAPQAAAEARHHGAHRQAIAYYEMLMEYADSLSAEDQAQLLENMSYEYYVTGQLDQAIHYRNQALEIWHTRRDVLKEGEALRWLSRLHWFRAEAEAARTYGIQALELLETREPGPELAMAYSNLAQLHVLAGESEEAIEFGNKAIQLAEETSCHEALIHALNNVGTAQLSLGDPNGLENLEKSLQISLEHHFDEHAARAYTNIASFLVINRDYEQAHKWLHDGIQYTTRRDLDSWTYYMRGWRARAWFEQGEWSAASAEAQDTLNTYQGAVVIQMPAATALVHLYVRQGHPEREALMNRLQEQILQSDELQRIAPLMAAKAEDAWFSGELNQVVPEIDRVYQLAVQLRVPRAIGELGFWLWRAGRLSQLDARAESPYTLQVQNDWRRAASEWARIGCPYEQAVALADGDTEAQQTALETFERLGARPAAEWLRRKMRAAGVSLPRRPRPKTRANPGSLTARQMEVLALLVQGLSDAEIANRLYISTKTAGHHVSSILNKLDVRSRQEAAILAVQHGWVTPHRE